MFSAILVFNYLERTTIAQELSSTSLYNLIVKNDSASSAVPYNKILDREFTKILNGQQTNFGTFASLGTKNEIASINGHIPLGGNSSLGINIKGGVNEGLVYLLEGEDVSSNISAGLQFNYGVYSNKNKRTIKADATQMISFEKMIDSLKVETVRKRNEVDNAKKILELDIRRKEKELREKTAELERSRKELAQSGNGKRKSEKDDLELIIMSLEVDSLNLIQDISYLKAKADYLTPDYIAKQKQKIESAKVSKYRKELKNLSLIQYNIGWFSLIANFNNKYFKLLESDNSYTYTSFNQLEFGINYNRYCLKDEFFGTYYLSFGVSYLLDDNFDDLSQKTFVQQKVISTSPDTKYIQTSKTVYGGDYESNISTLKIAFNSYLFLGYKKAFAIHLNPWYQDDFKGDSDFDLTVGLMAGFKNQEKKNNIINAELFYTIDDLFHAAEDEDDQFSDRSYLGVRLSFPISFNQNL